MYDFDFLRPQSLDEACKLLASLAGKAKIIAGGTDFMVDLHNRKIPEDLEAVVDISSLTELNYIREDGEYVRIGANVTHARIASSELLKNYAPLLAVASHSLGSAQVRNRGTIGGNLVNAAPCCDTAPPLVVLEAVLIIRSKSKQREVPIENFFNGAYDVNMSFDEILSEIYFRKLSDKQKNIFLRLARRNALTKSRMSLAMIGEQEEGRVKDLRVSGGSVTPVPGRFKKAEKLVIGKEPSVELFEEAARLISEEMIEKSGYRWSTEYKKPVIEELSVRAFNEILGV